MSARKKTSILIVGIAVITLAVFGAYDLFTRAFSDGVNEIPKPVEEYVQNQIEAHALPQADDEWNYVIGIGRKKMQIDPDSYYYCQRFWVYFEDELLILGPCRDEPHVFIFRYPAFVLITARDDIQPIDWTPKWKK